MGLGAGVVRLREKADRKIRLGEPAHLAAARHDERRNVSAVQILQRAIGLEAGDDKGGVFRAEIASAKKAVDRMSKFREGNSRQQSFIDDALQQRSQNGRGDAFPGNIGYNGSDSI